MRGASVVRWSLRVVVVLAALLAAAVVVLHTPWAHERARALIESRAATAMNGALSIGALTGNFFGHVQFSEVAVTQAGAPVITAATVEARYSPWRVLTTGAIDEVVIRGLHLNVVQEADGWNVLGLGMDRERDPTGPGPNVSIDRLEVAGGSARVDPLEGATRQVRGLAFVAGIDYSARRLELEIERAVAEDPDTGVAVRELSGSITSAEGNIVIDDLHLVTDGSRVDGSVDIERDAAIEIDLAAAPLSLAEIAHYVPQVRRIAVTPAVKVSATGSMADLAVTLAMQSDSAGSFSADGRVARTETETRITASIDAVGLDPGQWLDLRALDGRVTAAGTVGAELPNQAPERVRVSFDVRAPEVVTGGYRASTVRAIGSYQLGVLEVDGAAAAYGSAIQTTARWDGDRLTARGRMMHVNARRLPRQLDVPALDTDVTGDYDVMLDDDVWRVDATLDESVVEGATIAGGTIVRLNRDATLTYEIHGGVAELDLARIQPFVDLPPEQEQWFDGRINARVDATGSALTIDDAVTSVELRLTDSTVAGTHVPALDVRGTLDHRRLTADVTGTVTQLTSDAVRAGNTYPFRTDGVIDVHLIMPDVRNPGRLDTASGRAHITLTNAAVRGVPIETLELDAALAGGLAEIRRFVLASPAVQASAQGTLAVDAVADLPSDLTYELTAPDLSALEPLTGRPMHGGVRLSGRLTGPVSALRAQGELNAHQIDIAAVQALTVQGAYDVTLPDRDVSRLTSRFDGTSTFVQVGNTKIDRLLTNGTYTGGRLDLETTIEQQTRTIGLTGALVPHPDHREVHLTRLAIAAGGPSWSLAGPEALIQYGEKRVHVRGLDLASGTSRISLNGTLGTGGVPASDPLTIRLERVRVEDVNQILLGTHAVTGQIDGTATIDGELAAPRVRADVAVTSGSVDGIAFERIGGTAEYASNILTLDAAIEAGPAGRLTAAGTLPVKFGASAPADAPPFDLDVESPSIDLGLLQPLIGDHIEGLRGVASVDLRVTGPARAPAIAGAAVITNAAFSVAATGAAYPRLNARIAFDGTRLNVEQLRIEDDDQHAATLGGSLNLSVGGPPSEFNLIFTSDDFHLLNNQFGEVSVTSDLRVMGDLIAPLVTGTVQVDRARLEVDDLLDRFSTGGYKPVATEAAAAPATPPAGEAPPAGAEPAPAGERPSVTAERQAREAGAASNASFSISLDMPDSVVLRGRDLRARGGSFGLGAINITLGGALSIAKNPREPVTMAGTLEVVRGNYEFQSRRFTIARGSELRFDGGAVLNPAVDVTAERQIGGVLTRVHVTGTARAPEIALSSDPPLDEGDILSLIAFNTTMNELGTSQRVSLAARAGTIAARAVATPLADSVARALDFDVFEIQPADNAMTGGTVTIGRQVTDDLFVGFRQDFGSDDVSQISFEYRINEYLRLVTSFAQGADRSRSVPRAETAGLDLFFVIKR